MTRINLTSAIVPITVTLDLIQNPFCEFSFSQMSIINLLFTSYYKLFIYVHK